MSEMHRERLIERTERMLINGGYITCTYKGCFDIAAKKRSLLLLKILHNIDALLPAAARNLRVIAANLNAAALLVGERTNCERLQPGVVYERSELPAVLPATLEQLILDEIFPSVYRDRGGLYMAVDKELLRAARTRSGLSQAELAEAAGISKKVVYEHERYNLRMTLAIAEQIESILEKRISMGINLLMAAQKAERGQPADVLERVVGKSLRSIGFETDFVRQAPFTLFARSETLLISDIESNRRRMQKKAIALRSFNDLVKKPAIIITDKIMIEELCGIPVIERTRLHELSKKELLRIAKGAAS